MKTSDTKRLALLRVLSSPVRIELVEALQVAGPATVAELGERLGRAADSLYHHLRQLVAVGALEQRRPAGASRAVSRTKAGRAGRRPTVYALSGAMLGASTDATSPEPERRALAGMGAAILRLTERDLVAALTERWSELQAELDMDELPVVQRSKAWLTAPELDDLLARLTAVEDFLRARSEPAPRDAAATGAASRSLISLTFALTPLCPTTR